MLRDEGKQFKVCRNLDVKCAAVERAHCTFRNKLYKYFTYKNTFRHIDDVSKFVRAYNDKVHSTTGAKSSNMTDPNILAIRRKMEPKRRQHIRVANVRFSVGQHVHINEKMMFAKCGEQNFSFELFGITKFIDRQPRTFCMLEDLWNKKIEGQFYQEELTLFPISKQATYPVRTTFT